MPEVVDALLKYTESGPVTEWIERMANIVREMGLPLHHIEWTGTPSQVAYSLVGFSFRYFSSHDPLLKHIQA